MDGEELCAYEELLSVALDLHLRFASFSFFADQLTLFMMSLDTSSSTPASFLFRRASLDSLTDSPKMNACNIAPLLLLSLFCGLASNSSTVGFGCIFQAGR